MIGRYSLNSNEFPMTYPRPDFENKICPPEAIASRLAALPETSDPMVLREEFLHSFQACLLPVGMLDRFKVTGILATWWDNDRDEMQTISARGFAELVDDTTLAEALFQRIEAEWQKTHDAFFAITGQSCLLEHNPTLRRSLETRLPYLDALNLLQVDLLRRLREQPDDAEVLYAIHLTINGMSAGLRNSG